MSYSTMSTEEFSGALNGLLNKRKAAATARTLGWTGDDARASKGALCDFIAANLPVEKRQGFVAEGEGDAQQQQQAETQQQQQSTIVADDAATTAGAMRVFDRDAKAAATHQGNAATVAQAIATALSSVQLGVDEEIVRKVVRAEIGDAAEKIRAEVRAETRNISVTLADTGKVKSMGRQHKQFPDLLKMCAARLNVFIAGDAGSGKTTAAEKVAEALDLPFYFNGALDSEYKLMGFVDAQGRIVSTAFRKAFKDGGVYLFDEVDASLPGALLAFNAALANGHCDFPGSEQPIQKHPNFICIAAGNTYGYGATVEYVGRNRMDAAFMDRFVRLRWLTDEGLERALAGNDDWTSYVQGMRVKAKAKGLKVVISPRASIHGARLLAAGFSQREAAECTMFFGLTEEQRKNLEG